MVVVLPGVNSGEVLGAQFSAVVATDGSHFQGGFSGWAVAAHDRSSSRSKVFSGGFISPGDSVGAECAGMLNGLLRAEGFVTTGTRVLLLTDLTGALSFAAENSPKQFVKWLSYQSRGRGLGAGNRKKERLSRVLSTLESDFLVMAHLKSHGPFDQDDPGDPRLLNHLADQAARSAAHCVRVDYHQNKADLAAG